MGASILRRECKDPEWLLLAMVSFILLVTLALAAALARACYPRAAMVLGALSVFLFVWFRSTNPLDGLDTDRELPML
jgi:hypothetical protein